MGHSSVPQSEYNPSGLQITAVVPELRVADVGFNCEHILLCLEQIAAESPAPRLALFPELCLTGCTCGDLFLQPLLANSGLPFVLKQPTATMPTTGSGITRPLAQ